MTQTSTSKTVAPALRVLIESYLDYAGVFPPASLTAPIALQNYEQYRTSAYSWMLRWFVAGEAALTQIPDIDPNLVSVLADQPRSGFAALESKVIVEAEMPVYVEVPFGDAKQLSAVKESGCFAKMRTGGVVAEAIPSCEAVADFINHCADLQLPFKATAGLHHPLRSMQKLTYADDAPQAVMHGFINVLMAAAFAWQGATDIEPILSEQDASAFVFDDKASWRGHPLTVSQLTDMRQNFMHSVGACSFDEPVQDLQALGWLP
jgi:hypothetical protein